MVRAKFKCQEIKQVAGYDKNAVAMNCVVLQAAYGDENKEWAKYTPSGRVEMTIDNPDALGQFEVGKHYFLDFTPAPDAG